MIGLFEHFRRSKFKKYVEFHLMHKPKFVNTFFLKSFRCRLYENSESV